MLKKISLLLAFLAITCLLSACSGGSQDTTAVSAEYETFMKLCHSGNSEVWQHLTKESRRQIVDNFVQFEIQQKHSKENPQVLASQAEQKLSSGSDQSAQEGLKNFCKEITNFYYDLQIGKHGTAVKVDGDFAEVVNEDKMKYLEMHKEDGVWKVAAIESRTTRFSKRHFGSKKK
ncbi:TPA: hypothetical protein DD394_01155 [bacterium UBP9_UBA11836]|nr:hypothetical protein [bacterium UBP9_UBA11836]